MKTEERKEYMKEYYEKNKDKMREQNREYREKNKLKFVSFPNSRGKIIKVYANGMAQDIQKQVPKMMDKARKKLLLEKEK